jgi:hypothetical protein
MSLSRQLAAIMFTNIVGYTELMGEDQQKALGKSPRLGNTEFTEHIHENYLGFRTYLRG